MRPVPTTTIALRRRAVLADLVPGEKVRDIALVLAAAGFVGALAQVTIPLPFTPVPITGQTLGVLLAGAALGWRRAAASLALYLVAGFAGLPWFQGHSGGWQGASTGYLFGFLLAAVVSGALAERGGDRTLLRSVGTMLAGEACIYAVGVPWLALSAHVGLGEALSLGFVPFVGVDGIKLAIAAGLLPATWRLAGGRSAA